MNELRVDIGGSTRGFQIATEQTKQMARDLQRSLEGYTPQSFRGAQMMRDRYGDVFKSMGGKSGPVQELNGLLGQSGNTVLEMAGKYGKSAGLIGIFVGAITSAYGVMKSAFELQREASNLGVSATFLKGFKRAGEEQGVEDAQEKLYRVTDKIGAAAGGDKGAKDLFKGLGVQIGGRTMEEVLLQIAKAFDGIKDPAERAHKAVELFGRGGQAMLPVLKELAEQRGQGGGLATQALREGWQKSMLANMISVDDEEIAIEAKAYKAIKGGVAAPFRWLKGAWSHSVASVASGVFGVQADAPTQTRITEQESPEDKAAREKAAQQLANQQAQERVRLEREYREELEQTASLQTRLLLLQEDINLADTQRYAAKRAGDRNGELKSEIELMKKRKEFESVVGQVQKRGLDGLSQGQSGFAAKETSHVDTLGSMGGFVASAMISNQSLDIARSQLKTLESIQKSLEKGDKKDIYAP